MTLNTAGLGVLAAALTVGALAACGTESKAYDIAPIFPLTSGKCAKYDGKAEGSGFSSHCWVTKAKCQQAAADWQAATRSVPGAIRFTC